MKKLTFALVLMTTAAIANVAAQDADNEAIKKRLEPVGQVYLAGAQVAADTGPKGPRTGEQVYQGACFACHGTGALDAPKKGDAAWKPRIAQGADLLLKHAIEGIRAMPPRGTCMDCSDEEISAAIEFMIEGV
ncbi:cytochrome c5 family protein [Rheinheimera sediminis]|uniref:c-type cytochrome n=1 Tax=Rheinheimera sp. YQF-1 TaxID=2499626 RepID=UPI000FDC0CFC|nr:c-type cytochrome [Rheinheimera sp. YQF-1]RVT46752.1 cytochrome c5 family protein [Rheinheimera sp. YQF-1]